MFLKDILKNFTEFTGTHLRQSLLFNKVVGRARNFIKRKTLAQVFSCEFCQIFKNTFFTEQLWTTAFFHVVSQFYLNLECSY